jgi:imidazolonepropionase-like amidohydrolase
MEVSRDELAAAIDAAHERGAKVRAHIANKKAICMAVELGIDAVDHGDGLDSECIQLMAEHGAVLIPSCFFPFRVSRFRNGAAADRMVQDMKAMLGILSTADAAGVTIALGDDYGTLALEHGEYGQELSFYVEHAGITPQTAIRWATRNGAIMMGVQKDLGDLKPGMLADLIIVRGDPVVDITVLANPANILTVMKDGRLERNRLPLRLVGPAQ